MHFMNRCLAGASIAVSVGCCISVLSFRDAVTSKQAKGMSIASDRMGLGSAVMSADPIEEGKPAFYLSATGEKVAGNPEQVFIDCLSGATSQGQRIQSRNLVGQLVLSPVQHQFVAFGNPQKAALICQAKNKQLQSLLKEGK